MLPASQSIPNLIQGVSQQSDAQCDPTQGRLQINGYSSMADGLRKRAGTSALRRITTASMGNVFFHRILRDSDEQYLVAIGANSIRVFDLEGNEKTVSAPSGYTYLSTASNPAADVRAASIADFTFISNTKRVPAMAAALAPAVARPAAHEALVWVKAANYGQSYRVSANGQLATITTPIQPVTTSGNNITENRISTAEIAEQIKTALAGAAGVTIAREGSVLHLTSASAITIAATDARANDDITAITSSVQAFTDLPAIAPRGYQVEIKGDPSNQFDNYYVSFVPRGATAAFGEGAWEECVGPGMPYRLDAATMPHLLVRLANGTFYFGPANGTTQGGTKIPAWGERTAGDYNTAPDPSFIGYPIQAVFIHRNRLGLLADESRILSRAKSFFDFFPETVTTVLDTDPIDDQAPGGDKVSVLRHAVSSQDELILWSDQLQFRSASSGQSLTPATAAIAQLTAYECDTAVAPLQVAGGIVFAQTNGLWTQFREFALRGVGTALTGAAPSITDHVPTYIPAGIRQLAANDTAGIWFAITGTSSRIYVYKYSDRGSANGVERVQRSWSYWDLTAGKVLAIQCVTETLYLLIEYADGSVWLEKMPVADRLSTDALTTLLLDRSVTTTTATSAAVRVPNGTYNVVADATVWPLGYTAEVPVEAWTLYGSTQNGGKLIGRALAGATTITAQGDWRNKGIVFGQPFEFRYRFSKFVLKADAGAGKVASNVARTQVRHAMLRYHDTSFFKVEVTPERRDTTVYKFDGWILGVRNSQVGSTLGQGLDIGDRSYFEGVFQIPIASKGETCQVDLVNNTPNPCMFSGLDWIATITSRSRPIQ
jgi:hypothetical protein